MISKKLFTTIVMVGAFLMSATTQAQKVNTSTEISQLQVNDDDSGTRVIKYSADGHRYRIVMNGDKISDVYVDGAKLTASQYADYEPAVKKIIARIEADLHQVALDREKADRQRGEAESHRREAMKHRESAEAQYLKVQQLAKEAAGHQEHLNETIKESQEEAIRAKHVAEKQHEAAEDLNNYKQIQRSQGEIERQQAKVQAAQSEAARQQAKAQAALSEAAGQQAKIQRMQADKDRARAERDRQLLEGLIDEVVSDGLSQSKAFLTSLVLDAESFSLNGVKQSAELHAKYKSKYLKSPAKKITYKRSETSTLIMID